VSGKCTVGASFGIQLHTPQQASEATKGEYLSPGRRSKGADVNLPMTSDPESQGGTLWFGT